VKVLVLGGSVFLSATLALDFLERGHDVTCLSRPPGTGVPDGARHVRADRAVGPQAYDGVREEWDAVVDVATNPHFVRDALSVLSDRTRHWTYISSCSVYADQNVTDADENAVVIEPLDDAQTSGPGNYGASKSASEALCGTLRGGRAFIVRPGLIVGPGDTSDRGGYWPARFARGDAEVLVPEALGLWTQQIDVRDLSRWIVACVESDTTGVMNAVGDSVPLVEVIERIRRVVNVTTSVRVAPDRWLQVNGVEPWAGPESLPLWIPLGTGFDGFSCRSCALAQRHGLVLRPLEETWTACLDDERVRGLERERRAGLSAERESQLRDALRAG